MAITGIPTTRISDQFFRQRLLRQVQFDQSELYRLQNQLATGRRLAIPSDDPVSSLRVMSLQRLLERKAQVRTNIETNQSFLTATDTALGGASDHLADVRGAALGVVGTTSTDAERLAAAQEVEQAINEILHVANTQFRGRYLFAGSDTSVSPFEMDASGAISYLGNERTLQSYSDLGLLFETNVPGTDVFGAISEPVRGTADLNPALTFATRLADLRGGRGITPGSIAVSDGTTTSVIDLSGAETIGDVAALIRDNPPQGRLLDVQITATGLVLQLDAAPGDLSVEEAGEGTTAAELGILAPDGVGGAPLVGSDLDPLLRRTTRLEDILGTRATAVLGFAGADNDVLIEGEANGAQFNGVSITFVDDPLLSAGNEVVLYDALAGTIEVRIDENHTQAQHVIEAINAANEAGTLPFTARLDPLDEQNGGRGLVFATGPVTTAGGCGAALDQDAGFQIQSAGSTFVIDLSGAETVEDLLNAVTASGAGILAEINAEGTGIDLRSRLGGIGFSIGENGGQTATQLGLRTLTETTELAELNYGRGVAVYDGLDQGGADLVITRADGVSFMVDVSGAETVGDVLDRINTHADNLSGGVPVVVARLATYGNGIELEDTSGGPGDLVVARTTLSQAAIDLGLVAQGEGQAVTTGAGPKILTGGDVNQQETGGIFTALVRLREALKSNDQAGIERAVGLLDDSMETMSFARAELGARQQGLDALADRLDTEEVQLTEALSLDFDADLVDVISDLTARQTSMQAALQATAQIFRLTLMDYL